MSASVEDVRHWLWVTGPSYYLDENGVDRPELDPAQCPDAEDWWTCHKDTKAGDLVLLYRKSPRRDISYLIQTTSDAYSLRENSTAQENGWRDGCSFKVLRKFENPLTFGEIRDDPALDEWGALKGNFQRSTFAITSSQWDRLTDRLTKKNPEYRRFLATGVEESRRRTFNEQELEDRLFANPALLKPHGFDLEIIERQLTSKSSIGRVDLLGCDKKSKRLVVIELKNVKASHTVYAQIRSYLGWVAREYPNGKNAIGLVIARGFDNRFLDAASGDEKIKTLELSSLGLEP